MNHQNMCIEVAVKIMRNTQCSVFWDVGGESAEDVDWQLSDQLKGATLTDRTAILWTESDYKDVKSQTYTTDKK